MCRRCSGEDDRLEESYEKQIRHIGYNNSCEEYKRFVETLSVIEDIRHIFKFHKPDAIEPKHLDRDRAAVLIPLIDDTVLRILLTERAGSLGVHGGEVALPGGREDEEDGSSLFTALRETEEEIGVRPDEVEVIGELRPFVSKYGLLVTPIVGVVRCGLSYRPNQDEIASIFEVPLSFFAEADPIRIDELNRQGECNMVPAYDFGGYEIWGLTSLIIQEFMRVIEESFS